MALLRPLLSRFKMVSRRRQQFVPWRLSLLRILSHRKKHSALMRRRSKFRVCSKLQKRFVLQPCSLKRPNRIEGERDVQKVEGQGDVREAERPEDVSNLEVEKTENPKTSPVENDTKVLEVVHELPGMPLITTNKSARPGVIFIFEKASLVPALVGKKHQILNPDDHANFLRKKKKNPYSYRPEIIHLALLEVMDSALYQAGMVQAIYIKTDEGVLIKVEPHTRIPPVFGSFCAMMLELLQRFSIKAKGKREKLLRLVDNPVTKHLPSNCVKIGLSYSSGKIVPLKDYVGAISDDQTLVFVVGAMAHGKIDSDYTDEVVSVSQFPLSAATCVRKICCAVERKWKIPDISGLR